MPINDNIPYDVDGELDDTFNTIQQAEQNIQAEIDAETEPGVEDLRIMVSTKQLKQLIRKLRRLARVVKHIKRSLDGDVVDDDLGS